jgi:ATP-dependent helicase/DNAse subunit B
MLVCPFLAWAERMLGARELEEPGEELDRASLGSIAHRVLERLYRALPAQAWVKDSPEHVEHLQRVPALVDDALRWVEEEEARDNAGVSRFGPGRALEFEGLRASLEDLLEWDFRDAPLHARQPILFELSFGKDGTRPLALRNGAEELVIEGRIDRIDEVASGSRAGLWVVDYKSSSKHLSKSALFRTSVQLPVYSLAVRSLGLGHAQPETLVDATFAGYLRDTRLAKPPAEKKGSTWDEQLATGRPVDHAPFAHALLERFLTLRQGFVTPTGEEATCKYCGLRGACRKPSLKTAESGDEHGELTEEVG